MLQSTSMNDTQCDSLSVNFYLASQSPRRALLLKQLGLDFKVLDTDIDESLVVPEEPGDYVSRMAQEKSLQGLKCLDQSNSPVKHATVLGADTVIVFNQQVLGKPINAADAKEMLLALSGHSHDVLTGIWLCQRQFDGSMRQEGIISQTKVTFRAITEDEIEWYWQTGEPKDKAAGYAIQGKGAIFIEHISGSYSGVMGLPLYETAQLMARFGFPLTKGITG